MSANESSDGVFEKDEKRTVNLTENLNFAWKVHTAQEAWTAKVDSKASFILALVTLAIAAGVSVLISQENQIGFDEQSRMLPTIFFAISIGAGLLSLLFAGLAVWPNLGKRRKSAPSECHDLIYFGHLRRQSYAEIETHLRCLTPEEQLSMLGRQLKVMSDLNWNKHRFLQRSLVLGYVCIFLFVVSMLM